MNAGIIWQVLKSCKGKECQPMQDLFWSEEQWVLLLSIQQNNRLPFQFNVIVLAVDASNCVLCQVHSVPHHSFLCKICLIQLLLLWCCLCVNGHFTSNSAFFPTKPSGEAPSIPDSWSQYVLFWNTFFLAFSMIIPPINIYFLLLLFFYYTPIKDVCAKIS